VEKVSKKVPSGVKVPTIRHLRQLAKKGKGEKGMNALMPKKPGPKGKSKSSGTVKEILLSLMAGTYPTTGAKKKPRKRTVAGCYGDFVKKCERAKIEKIPSLRSAQRIYQMVPDVEKDAPKMTMRELDAVYGTRSVNEILEECRLQLDHVSFDDIEIERYGRKFKLQLSIGLEKSTRVILSPTWFEGKLNGEKLRAVLLNALTTDSDPDDPTLIPVDVLEIDGESPHRALKKHAAELAPLGAVIRFGPPRKPWQRGLVENINKHASQNLFPDLEVEIREFITRGRGHILKGKSIEEAYELIKEKAAKLIHAHNTKIIPGKGKSRLELFREKFEAKRLPFDLLGAQFFCKEQHCSATRIHQVQVSLENGNKTRVYHPKIVQGSKYRVLRVLGTADQYFLFEEDGTLLGRGEILRPGSRGARKAHVSSQKMLGELRRKSAARRKRGGKIRLQNTAEMPLPREGMREVLLDKPEQAKQIKRTPPAPKGRPKELETDPLVGAAFTRPEPVPATAKYIRADLCAFDR